MFAMLSVIHLIATQYFPAQRPRGEVLLFRRRSPKRIEKVKDEEMGQPIGSANTIYSGNSLHKQVSFRKPTGSQDNKENILGTEDHATFHWSNINYTVKTKNGLRHILNGVEGWVKPGTLTALMVGFLRFSS